MTKSRLELVREHILDEISEREAELRKQQAHRDLRPKKNKNEVINLQDEAKIAEELAAIQRQDKIVGLVQATVVETYKKDELKLRDTYSAFELAKMREQLGIYTPLKLDPKEEQLINRPLWDKLKEEEKARKAEKLKQQAVNEKSKDEQVTLAEVKKTIPIKPAVSSKKKKPVELKEPEGGRYKQETMHYDDSNVPSYVVPDTLKKTCITNVTAVLKKEYESKNFVFPNSRVNDTLTLATKFIITSLKNKADLIDKINKFHAEILAAKSSYPARLTALKEYIDIYKGVAKEQTPAALYDVATMFQVMIDPTNYVKNYFDNKERFGFDFPFVDPFSKLFHTISAKREDILDAVVMDRVDVIKNRIKSSPPIIPRPVKQKLEKKLTEREKKIKEELEKEKLEKLSKLSDIAKIEFEKSEKEKLLAAEKDKIEAVRIAGFAREIYESVPVLHTDDKKLEKKILNNIALCFRGGDKFAHPQFRTIDIRLLCQYVPSSSYEFDRPQEKRDEINTPVVSRAPSRASVADPLRRPSKMVAFGESSQLGKSSRNLLDEQNVSSPKSGPIERTKSGLPGLERASSTDPELKLYKNSFELAAQNAVADKYSTSHDKRLNTLVEAAKLAGKLWAEKHSDAENEVSKIRNAAGASYQTYKQSRRTQKPKLDKFDTTEAKTFIVRWTRMALAKQIKIENLQKEMKTASDPTNPAPNLEALLELKQNEITRLERTEIDTQNSTANIEALRLVLGIAAIDEQKKNYEAAAQKYGAESKEAEDTLVGQARKEYAKILAQLEFSTSQPEFSLSGSGSGPGSRHGTLRPGSGAPVPKLFSLKQRVVDSGTQTAPAAPAGESKVELIVPEKRRPVGTPRRRSEPSPGVSPTGVSTNGLFQRHKLSVVPEKAKNIQPDPDLTADSIPGAVPTSPKKS